MAPKKHSAILDEKNTAIHKIAIVFKPIEFSPTKILIYLY